MTGVTTVDLGPTAEVAASHHEMRCLAAQVDGAASRLMAHSAAIASAAAEVAIATVVSPATAGLAEAALANAAVGPAGIANVSVALTATAHGVRSALMTFIAVDEAATFTRPLQNLAVIGVGVATPIVGAVLDSVEARFGAPVTERSAVVAPSTTTLPAMPPPRSVEDTIRRIGAVKALGDARIEILTVQTPTGRRHIVTLPGTDGFGVNRVRTWNSDLEIRNGHRSAYEDGIFKAMAAAGIKPGEPVMLVGHSMGGMVAADVARHNTAFTITQVVAAGAPIGDRPLPKGVHLLALENVTDAVAMADGALPRNLPHGERVIASFQGGGAWGFGAHSRSHYEEGARLVDRSHDPEIEAALAGIQPFFEQGETTSQVFTMTPAAATWQVTL